MVPKIPSDPHRSHGIPQLKLSTLHGAERPQLVSRADVDFEQDVEYCGLLQGSLGG